MDRNTVRKSVLDVISDHQPMGATTMTDETMDHAQKVMKALLGKLYTILSAGDTTAPASTDSFIAWLAPGIPVDPASLAFAKKGTAGKTGDEARDLLAQAADFSRLVNMVPDASGVIG
jgi:hypothetical protein